MTKLVARFVLQVVLLGVLACPAQAQSEFLGQTFPYKAFDRLEMTAINVGDAALNVGFAPGEFRLPRSALIAWLETSAKAVSVYFIGAHPDRAGPWRRGARRRELRLSRCRDPALGRQRRDIGRTPRRLEGRA